jgi:hypothetical protein
MLSGGFAQIAVVARRSVIDIFGYFDSRNMGVEDVDWLLRLATKNKLGFVATPCILFRGRAPTDAQERMRFRFGCQPS